MREFILFLVIISSGIPIPIPARQSKDEAKLAGILIKAQDYCRRLDRAALDFVCQEDVEEEVNTASGPTATTVTVPPVTLGEAKMKAVPAPVYSFNTTSTLYDYQFIRKGTEVTERRYLLEKNGKKANQSEASPETRHFKFRDILFGASQLLSESVAARHDYEIAEDKKIKGEAVIVVVCSPKTEFAGKVLSGRAWVRARDGAVLKIDWDPESFGSYNEVLAVAEKYHMAPAIKSSTEFAMEKNGVRFPSLDVTEEAYGKGRTKFIRSTTTIKYKSYKFFTVETETGIRTGARGGGFARSGLTFLLSRVLSPISPVVLAPHPPSGGPIRFGLQGARSAPPVIRTFARFFAHPLIKKSNTRLRNTKSSMRQRRVSSI